MVSLIEENDNAMADLPDNLEFSFDVKSQQKGIRLDQFLVQLLSDVSRAQIIESNKQGLLLVNGVLKKSSYKLKTGDTVVGSIYKPDEFVLQPQKVDFSIIHEDKDLLVISKPPGIVVHPGSGNVDNTLVNGLLYHCQELQNVGDEARPGIVHRLDKDTSGIMVIAKSDLVLRKLIQQFKDRVTYKVYFALVKGILSSYDGQIVAPIGRHPVQRQKMAVNERLGKYAVTNWQLVEEFETEQGNYSLVRLHIETGRTHQIRVHMSHIGHPIVGDVVYGKTKIKDGFSRQMLHASRLRFEHPISGKTLTFTAPLWQDMQDTLHRLGWSGNLEVA